MSETSEITRPLIEQLNETGGYAIRMPAGRVQKGRNWIHLCEEGTADILFFPRSMVVWSSANEYHMRPTWIETKDPKGKTAKKRRESQAAFKAKVEALGHRYLIVKDMGQITEILAAIH